ncbi:MAG: SOS response-associated peptidase family protein [Xanthomonadales bacterium]|nr:SOS response-associated peptidase family protein [Xanthomonadales bacterium]
MCGKAAVSHLKWKDVYAWATSLTPVSTLPPDPASRTNISPSRLRRKSEPDSMVWETLPAIYADGDNDRPIEAIWPFLPYWSRGQLPRNKNGKLISTANARLRHDGPAFAPSYMGAWSKDCRVLIAVSWFYEFDSRVRPQIPYAVFPLHATFWMLCGLASWFVAEDGTKKLSASIITVEPNAVLKSVGHHRSPAILRSPDEAERWLRAPKHEALQLLRPFPEESMGVEQIPMGIKIPGNEEITLPGCLDRR